MELKLARKPSYPETVLYGAESTQVYRWPAGLARASAAVPPVCCLLILAGLYAIYTGSTVADLTRTVVGLLGVLGCVMVLALLIILHFVAAREIRFTRDCVVIRQTWRRDLVLPYSKYQDEWVADLSGHDLVRIITLGGNRGCSILFPPAWLPAAIMEIARIQHEEGWYQPEW